MLPVLNFFDLATRPAGQEQFATLLENGAVKIERIVSHSYEGPEDFWYDQAQTEWVIVLRGEAELEFEGGNVVRLRSGDYLTIPSHTRHRVRRTDAETFWLAVHVKDAAGGESEGR